MCHCTDCRYVTGALFLSSPELAGPTPQPPQDLLDRCVAYDTSPVRRRFFCKKCGSHVFVQETQGSRWWVMSGALEQAGSKDTARIVNHIFVRDTGDGGLVSKLLKPGGREVGAWEKRHGSRPVDAAELRSMAGNAESVAKMKNELLSVRCHCGGVDMKIARPDFNRDTQGVWDRYIPEEKDKYVAGLCVCRSCRLALGVSFQPWAYVPPTNVTLAANGKQVQFGAEGESSDSANAEKATTLRHFWSNKDTCRSFCGTCGATIFYWNDNRPQVVDVSVGVLRSDDGTMANKWLSWRKGGPSWREDCVDEEILKAVFPS